MKETLVLVGGGGHCLSCIDVIEAEGRFAIAGIVDAEGSPLREVAGYRVIGADRDLPALVAADHRFLVTVGQIKSPSHRIRLYDLLLSLGARVATVFSPSAIVSPRAKVGEGTIVMHQAVVNSGAEVGANCILNTRSLVEHEAAVGAHCHISTGAIVNGGARISDRAFLGSGSVVVNHVRVGADCLIGAGSVVHDHIDKAGSYAGVPARMLGASGGRGEKP